MDDTEWIPHTTKTGRILYYINPATGECKWQSQLHKRDHHCEPDVKSEKTTQQIECALQEKNVRCKNVTPLFSPHSHEQNHQEMHLPSTQETANKVIAGSGTSSLLQKHDEYTNACCSKDKEEDKSKFQSLQATTHLPNNGEEKSSEVWNNEELVTVDVLGQCKVGSVHGVENGVLVTPLPPSSNNAGNRADVSYSSSPKGSSLKILRCNQCNEQFSCPNRFTSHLRLHPEIDPLRCPLCSKEYSSTTSLTTHLRTHTGERPFTCLHCQKSFSQSSHLTTHLRVHTGEKPYQCPQCPKTFGQSSHLTLHLRIHNGDKPFQCRVCSKGFSHSSALSTHVRTHTGEKPFQCPHCPKKFGQTSHLKIHIRTHTGERPFQCPHCLKFFRQSCYLAKHVRSHSSNEPAGSPLTQTPQL